jgi:hypothetical protein
MGAYVCPSCGTPMGYNENDLTTSLGNNEKLTAQCPNSNVCGVERVSIIINKEVEDEN